MGVECSLYVDDFLICYRSRYVHIIERHLHQTLNKLQTCVDTDGFKFSESKAEVFKSPQLVKSSIQHEIANR